MKRRALTLAAAAALSIGASIAALAQERPGRYTMSPIDGGFLRLDTETGAVSICSKRGEQWRCEPATDSVRPRTEADASRPQAQLPSEDDIDRAIDELERLFKKYRERLREFDRSLASPKQAPDPAPPQKQLPPMAPSEPKSL